MKLKLIKNFCKQHKIDFRYSRKGDTHRFDFKAQKRDAEIGFTYKFHNDDVIDFGSDFISNYLIDCLMDEFLPLQEEG